VSVQAKAEARLLTADEMQMVDESRYPRILELARGELTTLVQRLREHRDRAQRIARQQRREMRGKADPRGAQPARDNAGTTEKAQVLAQALKRINREIARFDEPEAGVPEQGEPEGAAPTQAELSRKAAEMRRASRITAHPSAGRTAYGGMRAKSSKAPTVRTDPREIGRVSQAIKVAQAKRDT
jgi:hypothetical protein